MKEFIDKLIERLEEYKYTHLIEHDSERLKHCKEVGHKACDGVDCFLCVWYKATEIVNQLAEEYKPKTQTDKIRSMSDEELAIFLVNFKNTFGEEYEGEMSCLDWLQSEAE